MSQVLSSPREKVSWVLWARLLAGPILWATHSISGYFLVEAFCRTGLRFNILGINGFYFILVTITLIAVSGVAYLGLQSYLGWGHMNPGKSFKERLKRTKAWSDEAVEFMFFTGSLLSILFTVTIIAFDLPIMFLRTCV